LHVKVTMELQFLLSLLGNVLQSPCNKMAIQKKSTCQCPLRPSLLLHLVQLTMSSKKNSNTRLVNVFPSYLVCCTLYFFWLLKWKTCGCKCLSAVKVSLSQCLCCCLLTISCQVKSCSIWQVWGVRICASPACELRLTFTVSVRSLNLLAQPKKNVCM
jgi:hypothetical protein